MRPRTTARSCDAIRQPTAARFRPCGATRNQLFGASTDDENCAQSLWSPPTSGRNAVRGSLFFFVFRSSNKWTIIPNTDDHRTSLYYYITNIPFPPPPYPRTATTRTIAPGNSRGRAVVLHPSYHRIICASVLYSSYRLLSRVRRRSFFVFSPSSFVKIGPPADFYLPLFDYYGRSVGLKYR